MVNQFPFTLVPLNLIHNQSIPPNAKLLLGDIISHQLKHGLCSLTDQEFAELNNVSKKTISKWISLLSKEGHIRIEYLGKKRRCIFPANTIHKIRTNHL